MSRFVCLGAGCIRAHRCPHAYDQPHNSGITPILGIEPNGCTLFHIPPSDIAVTPADAPMSDGPTPPA